MTNKNTKEFGITEYMHTFEKSLNYMVAVLLAILVTAICCKYNGESIRQLWEGPLHDLYNEPKTVFFNIVAVLPTLPYYFYYTLRDNADWNMSNRDREKRGLVKLFILYETGVMSILYLLMQNDKRFAGTKVIISAINFVLLCLYGCILIKGAREKDEQKKESPGYFSVIIILSIIIFGLLFGHSIESLINSNIPQDRAIICLTLLLVINAGINILFLTWYESGDEIGIISNRIKVMIPVLSASTYTVSVFYCFYALEGSLKEMITVAVVITVYEIILCCVKKYKNKLVKAGCCITFFIAFVLAIPIIVYSSYEDKDVAKTLMIKWLILIGVSIYMAAIKYWGCILKYLKKFETQKTSLKIDVKINEMMTWLHNSILGSMLFLTALIISYGQYLLFLFVILICAIGLEYFIFEYFLCEKAKKNIREFNKIYNRGRIIEFVAIIVPIIFFVADVLYDFSANIDNYIKVSPYPGWSIALVLILFNAIYILFKWNDGKLELKEITSKIVKGLKNLKEQATTELVDIIGIFSQTMKTDSWNKFLSSFVLWSIYIFLSAVYLQSMPLAPLLGYIIIIVVVLFDWILLFKHLIDYYMRKMKMEKNIKKFQNIFEETWKNCLDEMNDFGESDAIQFKIGNRLRPILFFMGSSYKQYNNLTEEDYHNIAKAACSLELIHKSSVIFDDYIDKDSLRHGEKTFHEQYSDKGINTLILIGNTMLAKAQVNFAECKDSLRCNESATIENMKVLAQIIIDLCTGCYKELGIANYKRRDLGEIDNIIKLETVSLIKNSIYLGYKCFHAEQDAKDYLKIEELGEAFGYIFQYLNDLEPFSQESSYKEHKDIREFDYQKKNIALWTLYHEASNEDKRIFEESEGDYKTLVQLYRQYDIENIILTRVREKIKKITDSLETLEAGNKDWTDAFRQLFNLALFEKGWDGKISPL